jgi:hypothetical protein
MRTFVKWFAVLVVSLAPFMASHASRVEPLVNIENQAVARADGKPLTIEQVKSAIIAGSLRQRIWTVSPVSQGVMTATLNVRDKHTAVVDISYTAKSFSIKHRESNQLLYEKDENGVEQIHRNYNRWIQGLRQNITQEVLAINK